jgi:hypothetical protein
LFVVGTEWNGRSCGPWAQSELTQVGRHCERAVSAASSFLISFLLCSVLPVPCSGIGQHGHR